MTEVEIDKAFGVILSSVVSGYGWRVAWDNQHFEPKAETYVKPSFMPATTWTASLQNKGRIYRGIYQVLIIAPSGEGSQDARARAEEIVAAFEAVALPDGEAMVSGLRVNADGDEVYLTGPGTIGAGFNTDYGYNIPITLNYRADS
jgi:hypothetical protein|nr:MAG TPA: tail completion protein [Caudoviricetes sp.]